MSLIHPDRHTRIGLFLLSLAFAGIAFYLYQGKEGYTSGYAITGDYFSKLVDDEVSLGSLRAVALSDEFRSIVGGRVDVSDVPESPYHLRVSTIMASEDDLHEAHKRAISLLSSKLKELALVEVSSTLEYLDRVEKSRLELSEQLERSTTRSRQPAVTRSLSETDSARALLLRDKIGQLETFLSGGALSKTLRLQLDRETLRNAEIRVEKAERELARLARVFQADSKAVQAQQKMTEEARADLLGLERELAGIYLRTLRIEMEALDDKAASIVEQNSSALKTEGATTEKSDGEDIKGTEWLSARADEFHQRAEEIARAASLKQAGDLVLERRSDASKPIVVGCWAASLGFFLAALFLGTPPSPRQEEEERPVVTRREPVVRLEIADAFLRRTPESNPDHAEEFMIEIFDELSEALGRKPRRLLVVGDTNVESRLSFSIRLANRLGKSTGRVRLLDFDFQSKSLSERLGRETLPGVGDLLAHGGPVDEFFSSIAGTRIQFAAAGSTALGSGVVDSDRVEMILGREKGELAIVDASCCSPVEMILPRVDAVLCVVSGPSEGERTVNERMVLMAVRGAGLPVWGVSPEAGRVFPLL